MTPRKRACAPPTSSRIRGERLKDEVYRQMFRLEEGRAGSEVALSIALLRAWLRAGAQPAAEEYAWLQRVSSICLEMIEASQRNGSNAQNSPQ